MRWVVLLLCLLASPAAAQLPVGEELPRPALDSAVVRERDSLRLRTQRLEAGIRLLIHTANYYASLAADAQAQLNLLRHAPNACATDSTLQTATPAATLEVLR